MISMNQTLKMILDEMNHELGHFPGTTLDKNAYSKFADIYYDLLREGTSRNKKAKSKEQLLKLTRLLCWQADMQTVPLHDSNMAGVKEWTGGITHTNTPVSAQPSNLVDLCE